MFARVGYSMNASSICIHNGETPIPGEGPPGFRLVFHPKCRAAIVGQSPENELDRQHVTVDNSQNLTEG